MLLICHEEGLLGNELFAIDGCKISSGAAKEWSGTFSELEQKREKIQRQIVLVGSDEILVGSDETFRLLALRKVSSGPTSLVKPILQAE